jgi:hypothetical protein
MKASSTVENAVHASSSCGTGSTYGFSVASPPQFPNVTTVPVPDMVSSIAP